MRKLYRATVQSITKPKAKAILNGSIEDDSDFTDSNGIVLADIIDVNSGATVFAHLTMAQTTKWSQVRQIIFTGNEIYFEAEIEYGKIVRLTNFCSKQSIIRPWDQPGAELQKTNDTGKCLYYKHRGKYTCLKFNI